MHDRRFSVVRVAIFSGWTAATLASTALPALAQTSLVEHGTYQAQRQARPSPDFLLRKPIGSIGVRGSWVFARDDSDLYDFVQHRLTVDPGDFNTPALAVDTAVALTPRFEVVGGFQLSRANVSSEYREFVDNNFLPIEQRTHLKAIDLSVSARFTLAPPGARGQPVGVGAAAAGAVSRMSRSAFLAGPTVHGRRVPHQ
ncbi:MAG: hypothetical protein ABR606_10475 [Vicinamibacterales bacterium]